jgi:hypothetical protein
MRNLKPVCTKGNFQPCPKPSARCSLRAVSILVVRRATSLRHWTARCPVHVAATRNSPCQDLGPGNRHLDLRSIVRASFPGPTCCSGRHWRRQDQQVFAADPINQAFWARNRHVRKRLRKHLEPSGWPRRTSAASRRTGYSEDRIRDDENHCERENSKVTADVALFQLAGWLHGHPSCQGTTGAGSPGWNGVGLGTTTGQPPSSAVSSVAPPVLGPEFKYAPGTTAT